MNIRIIEIISLYILFAQVYCFQNNGNKYVSEILIATPVNKKFVSSDENSDLIIKGKKYWIHYKITYEKDSIVQFKRYLPEGPIVYSIEELQTDTAIYKNLNVPLKQNWKIHKSALYENSIRLNIGIIKLDETHFMEQNGRRLFVIKEKN